MKSGPSRTTIRLCSQGASQQKRLCRTSYGTCQQISGLAASNLAVRCRGLPETRLCRTEPEYSKPQTSHTCGGRAANLTTDRNLISRMCRSTSLRGMLAAMPLYVVYSRLCRSTWYTRGYAALCGILAAVPLYVVYSNIVERKDNYNTTQNV